MPQTTPNPTVDPIIAGDAAILARRYADAFYALADERGQLDEAAANLRAVARIAAESQEFQSIAANPLLSRAQTTGAMQKMAQTMKLNKLTADFLAIVAQNRRLAGLPAIIRAFLAKLAQKRGETTAEIRTAQPLSQAQQDQLAAALGQATGSKVHLSISEDAGLLGGLVVKIGSRLFDASVKNRLDRLELQLKQERGTVAVA